MARLVALLLLAGCAGRDGSPQVSCVEDRPAAEVAAELRPRLTDEGWRDVVVEARGGRWIVRGARDGEALAGKVEDRSGGCAGARVALQVVEIPSGARKLSAGPTGLARRSRLPVSP